MSQAFWCDYGNHAAKRDDDTIVVSKPAKAITITDQFGSHIGQVPAETIEICNECAVEMGFSNDIEPVDPAARHKSIEATVRNGK